MPTLISILRDVADPRRGNAQRHELLDILVIALVASVCGAESCVDFAEFAVDREPLLREFLILENGLPSHDTFSRVFRLLDPQAFGQAFGAFLAELGAEGAGVLAIDGKTLRRSFDPAAGRSALHVVTAFGQRRGSASGNGRWRRARTRSRRPARCSPPWRSMARWSPPMPSTPRPIRRSWCWTRAGTTCSR
ncbi:transposase, IS4 family [Frigidibacter mobilis]|uniref:Transposase, IS4 family n=1 Tax=Frigidibacter mobilis TaxID=1335048 RepID=A0A159Z258_9RHOB|nr:transposase, IS4 family [Frigidibacter mobilis]